MQSLENREQHKFLFFYYFVISWYFFFSASMILRPYVMVFWPAVALIGVIIFHKDIQQYEFHKYDLFCLIAILAIMCSVLYSVDVAASLKYLLSFVLYFIIAHTIAFRREHYDIFVNLILFFASFMCLVTFIQIFNPEIYMNYFLPLLPAKYWEHTLIFMNNGAYVGFTNQTSSNAFSLSIGIGALCYRIIKNPKQKVNYILIIPFLFALFFTMRRGSTIEILLLLIIFLLRFDKSKLLSVIQIAAIAGVVLYIGIDKIPGLSEIASKFIAVGSDISHGRNLIWKETLAAFINRPLTGYGIDSFTSYFSALSVGHTTSSAHNSYIQVLFELGIFGAILYFLPFIFVFIITTQAFLHLEAYEKQEYAILSFSFFIQFYCLLNATFEGLFSSEQFIFLLFTVQLMAIQTLRKYNLRTNGEVYDKK